MWRLPVTSLLLRRFNHKSVSSKSCRAHIQTSFLLVNHHHHRQTNTITTSSYSSFKFGSFILQTTEPSADSYEGDINMFMLSSSSGSGDDDQIQKKKMTYKLHDDSGFWAIYEDHLLEISLRMVGSCNGIICLHDPDVMDEDRGCTRQHYSNVRDVYLWNPATRQFRILPKMIPIQEKEVCAYGVGPYDFVALGFDVETKDYKVLRITPCYSIDMGRVQVYSLSTDSWRLLEDINSLPQSNDGIYLNGSCFFVGAKHTDDHSMLMSFDFTKEIFATMQLPENHPVLSSLDDKIVYKESLVSIMGGNVLLRWQLPSHGTTYKLNLDAPFIDSYFPFGIGLCLISDTGGCIGVRSLSTYVDDAEKGEALAMLEAIKWAIKLELSPIIIESDSKNVVSFFMEDDDVDSSTYWSSEALLLLREAKLLLNSSEIGIGISFQYCSKSRNYVADIAAKLGREGLAWSCKDWTANFPGEIVMSLSKDLGLETNNYWRNSYVSK